MKIIYEYFFEIGRYQIKENANNPHSLDYSLIIRNLLYPISIDGDALKIYSDEREYKKFISLLLESAPKPPLYESHLIAKLIIIPVEFILTYNELSQINFAFFKEYCSTNNKITTEFRQLHSNAICRSDNNYNKTTTIIPEAEEIFTKYFKTHLESSNLKGLIKQDFPLKDSFSMNKEWVFEIFNSWEGFENFMNDSETIKAEKEAYNEVMDFYNKYKQNNYNSIKFTFKHFQPTMWT